jgi:hypothetical protein
MVRRQFYFVAISLATLSLLFSASTYAQTGVPQLINYQGRLDSSNVPINGTRLMTFKIYGDSAGTNLLWTQSNLPVTFANGVFSVLLGSPTPLPAGLFAGTGSRYLGVALGSGSELVPRFRFTSVAYSMQAGTLASGAVISSDWGNNPFTLSGIANDNGATLDMDASNSTSGRKFSIMSTGPTATPGAGYFGLFDNTSSAWRYVVSPTGNLGVGTLTPSARLTVSSSNANTGVFTSDSLSSATYVLYSQVTAVGSADAKAVYGKSVPAPFYGFGGYFQGGYIGAYGGADTTGGGSRFGLYGFGSNGTASNYGVYGVATSAAGSSNYGVYGTAGGGTTNYAAYFSGNVNVTGTLSKGGGSFKIDDPIDPANKYLYHSFVESPDMKNIYDGLVVLDGDGGATIQLPKWFDALNNEFRYQLTAIGASAPGLYISQEVQDNTFKIAGGKPGMKVSWQVTGIRKDAFADAHRIPVEVEKPASERGKYLYPVEQGLPENMGVDYQNVHPEKKNNQ